MRNQKDNFCMWGQFSPTNERKRRLFEGCDGPYPSHFFTKAKPNVCSLFGPMDMGKSMLCDYLVQNQKEFSDDFSQYCNSIELIHEPNDLMVLACTFNNATSLQKDEMS